MSSKGCKGAVPVPTVLIIVEEKLVLESQALYTIVTRISRMQDRHVFAESLSIKRLKSDG